MTENLSWLKDVKPVETEVRKTARGRAAGENPVEHFTTQAFESGKTLAFSVPGNAAGKVERLLRRAGTVKGRNWSVSVQVLDGEPSAENTSTIPLRALKDLTSDVDVWLSVTAREKTAEEIASETKTETNTATESDAAPAPALADPFAGTPDADAIPSENGEKKAAVRVGGKKTTR